MAAGHWVVSSCQPAKHECYTLSVILTLWGQFFGSVVKNPFALIINFSYPMKAQANFWNFR